jgi:hypothetical protein
MILHDASSDWHAKMISWEKYAKNDSFFQENRVIWAAERPATPESPFCFGPQVGTARCAVRTPQRGVPTIAKCNVTQGAKGAWAGPRGMNVAT